MEPENPKVNISLQTKLLGSTIGILAMIIGILTVTAIYLLKGDKIAYIYDAQGTISRLSGREFKNNTEGAINVMKRVIKRVDPVRPISPYWEAELNRVLKMQHYVAGVEVGIYRPTLGEYIPLNLIQRPDLMEKHQLTESDLSLKHSALAGINEALKSKGRAFVNLSKVGRPPLLGIVHVGKAVQKNPTVEKMLAFGVLPLLEFQSSLPASVGQLTIFNDIGQVLFHTDPSKHFSDSLAQDRDESEYAKKEQDVKDPVYLSAKDSKSSVGTQEVTVDGIQYIASYFKPGYGLTVTTRTEYSKAILTTYTLTEKLLIYGVFFTSLATILALMFAKTLTQPIRKLLEATKKIAGGDFEVDIPVMSSDEIGTLSSAFTTMSRKVSELMTKMVSQVKVEQELQIASTVQSNLIPEPSYQDEHVKLKGFYQSADECGGDWWQYFIYGNQMVIVIADATGHGVPAALLTASVRGCFSAIHRVIKSRGENAKITSDDILPVMNTAVWESGRGRIHMTFLVGVLDLTTGELDYANAAHCPPWLVKKNSSKMRSLVTRPSMRLGEGPDFNELSKKKVQLDPGDTIFFYTDGILENSNSEEEMYGKRRAQNILKSSIKSNPDKIVDNIAQDHFQFLGEESPQDDVTMVTFTFLKKAAGSSPSAAPTPPPAPVPVVAKPQQ